MKTFEERFTAWVDGKLEGREAEELEKELEAHPEAVTDRSDALMLGELLRRHSLEPKLSNPDFFNHQLRQRIEAEERDAESPAAVEKRLFPIARLAWIGAFCLAMAMMLFQFAVPRGPFHNEPQNAYLADILESTPGDPAIYVTAFHAEKSGVTVLWLDGLEYLPASYALK